MTHTFNPALTNNRDFLRSLLADTAAGNGPFPKKGNFEDEVLDGYLTRSGGSVNKAYILACRTLATAWSSLAQSVRGTSLAVDAKDVADQWAKRATEAATSPIDGTAGSSFRVFNADCSS